MSLPLLAVSGEEIALALSRAGFRQTTRPSGEMLLSLGHRDVTVPAGPINGDALRELLREAGVSYPTFLDLLQPAESDREHEDGSRPTGVRARSANSDGEP